MGQVQTSGEPVSNRQDQAQLDVLGYHFTLAGLSLARTTIANFLQQTSRL
jgi:hypothetical protein